VSNNETNSFSFRSPEGKLHGKGHAKIFQDQDASRSALSSSTFSYLRENLQSPTAKQKKTLKSKAKSFNLLFWSLKGFFVKKII